MLTEQEEIEYLQLLEQKNLERVSPKLEQLRSPKRINIARGGRGAGAKSWGFTSLIAQAAHYEAKKVACLREVQKSLEESVYSLFVDTLNRLGYAPEWKITKEYLENKRTGSHVIFRGLKDIRAANQIKSLEGFDIFFIEEASTISHDSLSILIPTLRKPGSQLWACYNPDEELDPITDRFWNSKRKDMIRIELAPGKEDNPWWTNELQKEMEEDFARDPELALHIWHGLPKQQGEKCVMSRARIKGAQDRKIEAAGGIEVGCDVARFGQDNTEIFKRHGLKTIGHWEFKGQDTQFIADKIYNDIINRDPSIPCKIDDTGVGGGVSDRLNKLGAKVIPIDFNGRPSDVNKYTSIADEMWFEFPIDEADIPNDSELLQELGGRMYDYDSSSRKKIESKEKFRKRYNRSPDKADALLLCYYNRKNTFDYNAKAKQALRRRSRK